MGAKAVTALSEWTEAEVRRNGRVYVQEYERGKATTRGQGHRRRQGHRHAITFKPDPEIFKDITLRLRHAGSRLRDWPSSTRD